MTDKKTTLHLDEATEAILAARDPAPGVARALGQRGPIIRELLRRYDEICREHLPQLSEEEWAILLEAARSWRSLGVAPPSAVLLGSLLEASRRHQELLNRLLGLTVAERIALVDALERRVTAAAIGRTEKPTSRSSRTR